MDYYQLINRKQSSYLQFVQLTDTHIFQDINKDFDGVNTYESLKRVIQFARQDHWPPDAILLTGDLVHDPTVEAYKNLLSVIQELEAPVICLPGNHDSPGLMYKQLNSKNVSTHKLIVTKHWIIIMLNTVIENSHSGKLESSELEYLDQTLQLFEDKFSLICLHHPPVKIGSPWMDAMGLENSTEFFSIVDKHNKIKGILWGHIHQEFSSKYNEILLMATPSTCIQFKPGTDKYTVDNLSAGYRNLKLFNNGEIETEIARL